jgi:ATP-dependent Clp protease protease subunit
MKVSSELVCIENKNIHPTVEALPYIFVTKFDEAAVSSFYKEFLTLQAKEEVKVIPVVISSYGGQVYSLLSMLDIIGSATKPVATIALGKAMSCGAVLLAAGTKGYRYAAPNADVLIHEVSSGEWGKITETTNSIKQINRLNKRLLSLLEDYSGQNKGYFDKRMKKMINVDWYLSANECKKLNLIDHVSVPALVKK